MIWLAAQWVCICYLWFYSMLPVCPCTNVPQLQLQRVVCNGLILITHKCWDCHNKTQESMNHASNSWYVQYQYLPRGAKVTGANNKVSFTWIILCMCPANERWHYIVMSSLIGWVHIQNDPCFNVKVINGTKMKNEPAQCQCQLASPVQLALWS